MRTMTIVFGTGCLATGTLIGADEGAFTPVLSNHPELIRPDHQCPVSFSREPLRYYTGQVIQDLKPVWLMSPLTLKNLQITNALWKS